MISAHNPYLSHYRTAFASSTLPSPQAHPRPSRLAFPLSTTFSPLNKGDLRVYHVPHEYHTTWVRFRLSAGGTSSAIGELGAPILDPLPFGPSLCVLVGQISTFSLFSITTFISGSHLLTIPRYPRPRPPRCWQSQRPFTSPLPSSR